MRRVLRGHAVEVATGAVFAALVLGYAVWIVLGGDGVVAGKPRVGYGPDSQVYVDAASAPVWSLDLLAARGPFGFSLLVKLCASNLRAVVVVQSLGFVAAWVFLAATVGGLARRRAVAASAFAAVLAIGASAPVVQWNAFITTESMSLSLLCVVIACGLRVAAGARGPAVAGLAVALVAWGFTRDTNATIAGLVGVLLLVVAVARPAWRRVGALVGAAGIAVAVAATTLAHAADPPRWFWPVTETIVLRYLDEPDAVDYLAARGMPLDERTWRLKEAYFVEHVPLEDRTGYHDLRAWLEADGRDAFVGYLLSHPVWTLREPFVDRDRLLAPTVGSYARVHRVVPPGVYEWTRVVGFPAVPGAVGVATLAAIAALVGLGVRRRDEPGVVAVVGLVLTLAVAGYYAAWHGDALEIDRHALTAAVQLRLGIVAAAALAVDVALARLQREPAREAGGDDHEPRDLAPGGEEDDALAALD
jgi:hypothetical protein